MPLMVFMTLSARFMRTGVICPGLRTDRPDPGASPRSGRTVRAWGERSARAGEPSAARGGRFPFGCEFLPDRGGPPTPWGEPLPQPREGPEGGTDRSRIGADRPPLGAGPSHAQVNAMRKRLGLTSYAAPSTMRNLGELLRIWGRRVFFDNSTFGTGRAFGAGPSLPFLSARARAGREHFSLIARLSKV
jgi:hypothetical protein